MPAMEPVRSSRIKLNKKIVKAGKTWALVRSNWTWHDPIRRFLFSPWKRSEKNHRKDYYKEEFCIGKALLCFLLTLVGSVYSGDVHLLNFK